MTQMNTIISKTQEVLFPPLCFSSQTALYIIEKTWTFPPTSIYQDEVKSPTSGTVMCTLSLNPALWKQKQMAPVSSQKGKKSDEEEEEEEEEESSS